MQADRPLAVSISGLQKRFGATTVLQGIDLEVEPGQVFGYIGPNGAGKSTTVKILVGMLDFTDGTVEVAGVDVRKDPREVKRRIGYLPENAALYESLTVSEHLQLIGRLHGMEDEECETRSRGILDAFDLLGRAHSRIGSLSKGMRQKVMITSALVHDPEILFMDEPLSGLDVFSTALIKELVRALADSGKTVFYCSHMMDVVERVCDRIAIIDDGKIVADGTFAELTSASRDGGTLERIFLEMTEGGDAASRASTILAALGSDSGNPGSPGRPIESTDAVDPATPVPGVEPADG